MIILIGWKDISRELGVSIKTAKKWVKKYKIPMLRREGRPTILQSEISKWWVESKKNEG